MKIIKNEKLIKRNGTIAGWALGIAIISMGGGMYANLTTFQGGDNRFISLTMAALGIGLISMYVGLYLTKRFGGRPRVDEKIDSALKGLPGDYTLYHFTAPVPHLLVGPAGIWTLIPYHQRGTLSYEKNRWRISSGGFAQSYMSIFGLEGIGRPDYEAEYQISAIKKRLARSLDENEVPDVQAALIFTNEQMDLQVEGSPIPALKLKQLKDFLRQKAKERPISHPQLVAVKAALLE
ncbi:MAG TPA: hypothetical protein VFR47_01705 [Anaerolineales bacterium]|nr:hypothetical protein [Anaerolineales bacterium]